MGAVEPPLWCGGRTRNALDSAWTTPEEVASTIEQVSDHVLIYIMGRPHSGSTILDIALGNSTSIESVGELMSGLAAAPRGHRCACGELMSACPYWSAVRAEFETQNAMDWAAVRSASLAQANIRKLLPTVFATAGSSAMTRAATAATGFTRAIGKVAGKPHVLDSSKEPTRALMLARHCPDARLIHLVRDPRRAVASHYWRFKGRGGYFHFLRRKYTATSMLVPFMFVAAASWTIGNLVCELARRRAPERTIRVRYEDLCVAPAATFRRIGRAFDLSLDDLIEKIEQRQTLAIGHNVGGNQIRRATHVTFQPEQGQLHALPRWLEILTVTLCWPLMLVYAYDLRSSGRTTSVTQVNYDSS